MEKNFRYSVLKYRPSYLLDERVNIGLLFVFETDKKVEFIYPENLTRITQLFPDANLDILKTYLNAFQEKALFLSKNTSNKFEKLNDELIEREFLINESNNLFFSESKNGNYLNVSETVAFYNQKYFEVYLENYYKTLFENLTSFNSKINNIRNYKIEKEFKINNFNNLLFYFLNQKSISNIYLKNNLETLNKKLISINYFDALFNKETELNSIKSLTKSTLKELKKELETQQIQVAKKNI